MAEDRREYQREYYIANKGKKKAAMQNPPPIRTTQPEVESVPPTVEIPPQQLKQPDSTSSQQVSTFSQQVSTVLKPLQDSHSTVSTSSSDSTVFKHPLSTYASTFLIAIFLTANTAFLIKEQAAFYELKGLDNHYAYFVAILTEFAAILLSFFGSWYRRSSLFMVLVMTLGLIFAVIFLGLDRKETAEATASKLAAILKEEIDDLKSQKATLEAGILEGRKLHKDLQKVQDKLETKQETYRKEYAASVSSAELWVLAALRGLAILWNISFAALLAYIWRGSTIRLFPEKRI